MSEQERNEKSGPDEKAQSAEADRTPGGERDVHELTPEEQMALYEEDLKENDWGHQPC